MGKPLSAYDKALIDMKEKVWTMGETSGQILANALSALTQGNAELARCVLCGDEEIDRTDDLLEQDALNLLSLAQPTDADLRFLTAVIRISHELERICDNACNIAEIAMDSNPAATGVETLEALNQMGRQVLEMIRKCLKIFRDHDLKAALEMNEADRIIDRMYFSLLEQLKGRMKNDPGFVDEGSGLLLCIRFLERIGDHSVNIAEMLIFAETGEKHPSKRGTGMSE